MWALGGMSRACCPHMTPPFTVSVPACLAATGPLVPGKVALLVTAAQLRFPFKQVVNFDQLGVHFRFNEVLKDYLK